MAIKQEIRPYEALLRWNPKTGEYSGCHFKQVKVTFDDETNNEEAADQIGNASPQILAKMKTIIGQAVIDGAKRIDVLTQEKDDAISERDNLIEENRGLINDKNVLATEHEDLKRKYLALEAKVNGI